MTQATWVGSPNFDTDRKLIDRLVIHWIAGNLVAADAQFQKKDPGTSAHYGIEDNNVHQYVIENNVAYHAGSYPMNQRSIGIEHSAAPDRPASEATYQTSGKLIGEICKKYNIPLDRTHIIKHSEVKATQCPGTMDLDKLINIAKGFNLVEAPDVEKLRQRISTLESDIAAKEKTSQDLERQRNELSEDLKARDIAIKAEQDKYTRDVQFLASKLGTSDDIKVMGVEIDLLLIAEEAKNQCLTDKRECGEKRAQIELEYTKTLENLSLLTGYKVATSAGVERALQSYLKLHQGNPPIDQLHSLDYLGLFFKSLFKSK